MRTPLPLVLLPFAALATATIVSASDGGVSFGSRVEQAVAQGSVAKLQALRASLERQSNGDPYDSAYLDWRESQLLGPGEKKHRRRLLRRAQRRLETLLDADPGNAEAHALHGSAIGAQITGMWSGMRLGRKSTASLNRGLELEPENPRIALQRGISFFFTPKSFGGGVKKAEQELRRALGLFAEEPVQTPWPNWGRVDAFVWLGATLAKAGRLEEAREAYEEALRLAPGHLWVREELLPALEAANR